MSLAMLSGGSRCAPRESVDCPSRIWSGATPPSAALIVNLSPYGCMVRGDRIVPVGAPLMVELPEVGALRGTVIWSMGARIGMEFDTPIPLDRYLDILATALPAAGPAAC